MVQTPVVQTPLVLVGPMGSGKSAVARAVADLLSLPMADTDQLIEARAGQSITELFTTIGEPGFRQLEHEVIAQALTDHRGVLALGGGAVLDPRTRALLTDLPAAVVHLDVDADEALRRLAGDATRPLLATSDPRATWLGLATARRQMYQEVATMTVPTTGRTPQQVAQAIIDELGSGRR